jgi:transcriptional regulator GlxA family with amidase domain
VGRLDDTPTCTLVYGLLDFEAKDHPMLMSLGDVLVVRSAQVGDARRLAAWVEAVLDEVRHPRAGTDASMVRLSALLLIESLRVYSTACPECPTGGWLRGMEDPALGRALAAFHRDVAAPWTVASLARTAGQSRAAFARHFDEVLGEPPLAYARRWRLFHARRLLRTTQASLAEIAQRVGYRSAPAFSSAFSSEQGVSPGVYRAGYRR